MQPAVTSLSLLSAIDETAAAAVLIALLAFALSTTRRGRGWAAAILAAWFVSVVALGSTAALAPQRGAGPIALGLTALVPIGALCYLVLRQGAARALEAVPLPVLIGVNALRLLGVSFLLLYAARRLPAPFAPLAGWGDVFIGAAALPVAWLTARRGGAGTGWLWAWNLLGILDLSTALALGALSSPGPIQLFSGHPDSGAMTSLPWILIPGFLVPIFWTVHIAIFARIGRRHAGRVPLIAAAGSG